MIYWNPLYEVFLSDGSIFFADERGNFSLTQPPGLQGWGILGDLDCGLVSSKIERATYLERRLLALLAKRNLIVELPMHPALLSSERSVGHYLTFNSDPVAALQRLRSATVCVLGVGGVGAVVLQHLVALGVRSYILVDSDRVEASNLNRQFIFSTKDIERLKVEAASEFVCSRVQDSKITKFANRINSRESLDRLQIKRCDIIVHCLDTPRQIIDDIVYGYGKDRKIPVVTAGVGVQYGHWGPLISPDGENATYEDWKRLHLKPANAESMQKAVTPTPWSFGPTNTLIAASLVRDVAEWLAGRVDVSSFNTRLVQRFSDNQIRSYRVGRSDSGA